MLLLGIYVNKADKCVFVKRAKLFVFIKNYAAKKLHNFKEIKNNVL